MTLIKFACVGNESWMSREALTAKTMCCNIAFGIHKYKSLRTAELFHVNHVYYILYNSPNGPLLISQPLSSIQYVDLSFTVILVTPAKTNNQNITAYKNLMDALKVLKFNADQFLRMDLRAIFSSNRARNGCRVASTLFYTEVTLVNFLVDKNYK